MWRTAALALLAGAGLAGPAHAQVPQPAPALRPQSGSVQPGILYDLILATPQFPLARLAVDNSVMPPRLVGIGPKGDVYAITIFIGAPVLEPLRQMQPPPPPSLTVVKAATGAVEAARYGDPVTEGQRLVGWRALQVRRRSGEILDYRLPEGALFTGQKPLLVDLRRDGLQEVLTVRRDAGGRHQMVMFFPSPGKLTPVAETPLAKDGDSLDPIGVADVEGNGQEQIALIRSPESNGYLETYALENGKLRRKWRLYGYSSRLPAAGRGGVAVLADLNGDTVTDLLLPRNDLLGIGVLTMAGGYSRPLWRTEFLTPVASEFTVLPDGAGGVREIAFLLRDGKLGVLERRVTAARPR